MQWFTFDVELLRVCSKKKKVPLDLPIVLGFLFLDKKKVKIREIVLTVVCVLYCLTIDRGVCKTGHIHTSCPD